MLTTAQPQPNGKPPGAQNQRVHANPALLKGKPLRPVLRPRGFELTLTSPSLPLPSLLPRKSCRLCLRTVGAAPPPSPPAPRPPFPAPWVGAIALPGSPPSSFPASRLQQRLALMRKGGFGVDNARTMADTKPQNLLPGHSGRSPATHLRRAQFTLEPPLPLPTPNRGLCMAHQGPAASPRGPPQAPHGKAQRAHPRRPSSAVLGGSFCSDRARVTRLCGMILGNKTAHFTRTGILPLFRRQRLVHGRHS